MHKHDTSKTVSHERNRKGDKASSPFISQRLRVSLILKYFESTGFSKREGDFLTGI